MARKNKIPKFKVTSKIEKFFSNSSATLIPASSKARVYLGGLSIEFLKLRRSQRKGKKNSMKMFYLLPEKTKS